MRGNLARLAVGLGCVTLSLSGCATRGFDPVAVTKDPAVVASCQKVDDLELPASTTKDADADNLKALLELANTKGANTLLVQSDEPKTGVAYKCSAPAAGVTR